MNWHDYTERETPEKKERKRAKVFDEIRARVTWGEAPDEILTWALGQDLEATEAQIQEVLDQAVRERSRSMRRRGRRDLLIGLLLMLPGAAVSLWMGYEISVGVFMGKPVGRIHSGLAYVLLLPSIVAAAYGGWRTYRGLDRVVFGHRAAGIDA